MTVYVDVVVGFNFVMNFLVFSAVRWISGAKTRIGGIVSASLLGGFYSVFMFDERFAIFYSPVGKFAVSLILLFVCFRVREKLLKLIFYYYITSFAFSGAAVFISNFSGVLNVKNGMFYYENNIWILIVGCVLSFFVIRYVLKHMRMKFNRYGKKLTALVSLEGKEFSVTAMSDSGNSLLDPITLYPVMVVEYESIKECVPDEMAEFLKEGNDLNCNMSRKYLDRIRLVPYTSVGGSDILKGFRPDYMKLEGEEEKRCEIIIAVTYKKLSPNDEFDAILNPMM